MNRERLTILRDHLASLPDERVDMRHIRTERECGTVCCIAGWANELRGEPSGTDSAAKWLGLTMDQRSVLFYAELFDDERNEYVVDLPLDDLTRQDAIAAIQSMLDSPDDDALPVWSEKAS